MTKKELCRIIEHCTFVVNERNGRPIVYIADGEGGDRVAIYGIDRAADEILARLFDETPRPDDEELDF